MSRSGSTLIDTGPLPTASPTTAASPSAYQPQNNPAGIDWGTVATWTFGGLAFALFLVVAGLIAFVAFLSYLLETMNESL